MYQSILQEKKQRFEDSIAHFQQELGKIRTGRAHAGLLDGLMVEAYGATTPLNQLASVNVPDARTITIQPWDKSVMGAVETAIRNSDLGLNPANDGALIRLIIPALTQERREQIVKSVNTKAEEARIAIRNIREEAWKELQKAEEAGEMSEDDKFAGKDALQKHVDEYNKKIEEIREKKEKELMTV